MWLIVIDSYTKWLEVKKMKSTSALATCRKLREIFASLGLPRILVSDNGPQWTSDDFKQFCQSNNIQTIRSSPYHPKSNGLAERAVRTFKERMTASRDIDARLQQFLMSYRNAPQKSTGRPPSELIFGRRLRTRLELLKPDIRASMDKANFRQQLQHDKSATPRSFKDSDAVWVLNPSGSGYQPGEIHRRTGPLSYNVLMNEKIVRKHADQLRLRSRRAADAPDVPDADASDENDVITPEVPQPPPPPRQPEAPPPSPIPVRQPPPLPTASPSTSAPPPEVQHRKPTTSSRHRAAVAKEKETRADSSVQQPKDSITTAVSVQDQGQDVQTDVRRSTRIRRAPKVLYNPE
jgi:hypothetical protein